jgi:hypothetical protein
MEEAVEHCGDGGQEFHVLFACAIDCGFGDFLEQSMGLAL